VRKVALDGTLTTYFEDSQVLRNYDDDDDDDDDGKYANRNEIAIMYKFRAHERIAPVS
jgi:hypothetical protein